MIERCVPGRQESDPDWDRASASLLQLWASSDRMTHGREMSDRDRQVFEELREAISSQLDLSDLGREWQEGRSGGDLLRLIPPVYMSNMADALGEAADPTGITEDYEVYEALYGVYGEPVPTEYSRQDWETLSGIANRAVYLVERNRRNDELLW